MSSSPRSAVASVIGWVIVALVALWAFGVVIGWLRFVLRSLAWVILIGILVVAYLAVKAPPDD